MSLWNTALWCLPVLIIFEPSTEACVCIYVWLTGPCCGFQVSQPGCIPRIGWALVNPRLLLSQARVPTFPQAPFACLVHPRQTLFLKHSCENDLLIQKRWMIRQGGGGTLLLSRSLQGSAGNQITLSHTGVLHSYHRLRFSQHFLPFRFRLY